MMSVEIEDRPDVAAAAPAMGSDVGPSAPADDDIGRPPLDFMRGYIAGRPRGDVLDETMRGWLDTLINEVEQLRDDMLDAPRRTVGAARLTPMELTLFRYLRNTSMSMGEIARARFVSVNTIKTQAKNVYAKFGINKRVELRYIDNL